jgi:3-oxoacyl-[acyl-carrier protein] reductase
MVSSRSEEKLHQALESLPGSGHQAQVADTSDASQALLLAEQALSWSGDALDAWVFNTGGPTPKPFTEASNQDWQSAFDSLFLSFVTMARVLLPAMQRNGRGTLVIVGSSTAKEPVPGLILSNPFRAAITSVAKSLAQQYAGDGITVNVVNPASVETERTVEILTSIAEREGIGYEELRTRVVNDLPMKRLQTSEEVGALIGFLCSEAASGISGQAINVDGAASKFIF